MADFHEYPVAIAALLFIIKMMWDQYTRLTNKHLESKEQGDIVSPCQKCELSDNFKNRFYSLEQNVKELHQWHNKEDEEGRKIWYFKPSLEKAVEKLAVSIDNNTKIHSENMRENTEVLKGLKLTIEHIDES